MLILANVFGQRPSRCGRKGGGGWREGVTGLLQ